MLFESSFVILQAWGRCKTGLYIISALCAASIASVNASLSTFFAPTIYWFMATFTPAF
jgi:hypothetical protein